MKTLCKDNAKIKRQIHIENENDLLEVCSRLYNDYKESFQNHHVTDIDLYSEITNQGNWKNKNAMYKSDYSFMNYSFGWVWPWGNVAGEIGNCENQREINY